MDLTEMRELERRPSMVGGIGYFLVGVAVVAAGAWLIHLSTTYTFDGPPTCDGNQMAPGDSCLVFGGGKSYDYETGVRQQEAWGQTWRLVAGMLVGGVGAAVVGGGANQLSRGRLRTPYLLGAAVLLGAVGYLLSLGTASTTAGAIGAAAGAVWVLAECSDQLVSRGAIYLAGLVMQPVAALLVVSAASYQPEGGGYGLDWSDQMNLFVMELFQQHGDWVRLVVAAAAVAGAAIVVVAAAIGLERYGRPTQIVLFGVAALVALASGAYALSAGTLAGQLGLAAGLLLACFYAVRAARTTTVPTSRPTAR